MPNNAQNTHVIVPTFCFHFVSALVAGRSGTVGLLPSLSVCFMATNGTGQSGRKRKERSDAAPPSGVPELPENVGLEMLSEDEDVQDAQDEVASDDSEVDEFPEIVASSDEGEDDEEDDEGEEDEEDHSEKEESSEDTDVDLVPYPKPKTIISDITGHPKRVYPEIEADYDSDSSTEDVSYNCMTMGSSSA